MGTGPLARRSRSVGPSTSSRTIALHAARFFRAVDRADVDVIERGEQARLAREPRQGVRIALDFRRQHFERDVAPKAGIVGAIDLAHSACT